MKQYINQNVSVAHTWEIIACLNLDSLFFLVAPVFIFKGKGYRTLVAIFLFYLIRALLQRIQTSPFPDGLYWQDPGFPSLVNIYGNQSDFGYLFIINFYFFYSGHIGFWVFCTIEFFNWEMKYLGIYGIFSTVLNFITLICFRVHYTIDLFTGLIMAHYIYYLTGFVFK